ncbi:type VI secretion system Vgr family protein [Thauera butanivorans]|uniref:type VI secretion system Vgr family protein n=1 Tax=Thauera butanivorans TaxID=86174 RepID=UPI003AB135CF
MNRLLTAHTPLGDALWAVSLSGREALSSLYRFTVRFKSESPELDCQAMIGERCAIELETDRRGRRWLSGQMIDFAAVGHEGRHWVYETTLAPRLWHASRRADFRIWQNQSVPDILYQVLGENAVRFDMRLKARYKRWTYLVQYRETDLSFICRQLEHEGIFFWFEHAADGETLVLADHLSAHPDCPGYATVPYYSGVQTRPDRDHFDAWRLTRRVETGRLIHADYDFERPSSDLTTEHADPRGHLFDHYTRYHYPGDYLDPGDGAQYAANTLERLQRQQETIHLSGRVRGAAPGHRLTLTGHPRADQNRELTLVAVSYDIADNDYEGAAGSTASHFHVDVEALPAERPFRPPLATPKPRARGVETAVVVGPPGEEIHTDEYGRVKVHFHWDRYGKKDGTDTCWIRVASPWAGSNFGAIHIPRIGQEVIVDFEHGDPDRPIITGRVYNAEQMPPWSLPANRTQSGILTRSSKGGAAGAGLRDGAGDANALRFEDKKGAEQVWFHAQKDALTEVEHDESKWVGNDRRKEIDRDEFNTIHRDRTEVVDRNEKIDVHGWRTETVDLDETLTVHQNRTRTVDGNEALTIHKSRTKTVDRNETDRIGKNWSIKVGKNKTETIAMAYLQNVGLGRMENVGLGYSLNVGLMMNTLVGVNQSAQIGKNKSTTVGTQYSLTVGAGGGGGGAPASAGVMHIVAPSGDGAAGEGGGGGSNITMDAESITLKVGASTLVMKADGTVTINGKNIDVVGSEHVQVESSRIDLN